MRTTGNNRVLVEWGGHVLLWRVRQANPAHDGTRPTNLHGGVGRLLRPDTFQDGVGTVAVGQLHDLFDGLVTTFGNVVGGTEFLGQGLAIGVPTGGNDLLGAPQLGGNDGTETNGTVTHDDDRVARADVGNPAAW